MTQNATNARTANLLGRAERLSGFLQGFVKGTRTVKGTADSKLLFEAICSQDDRVIYIEKIACSECALLAI